MSLRSKVGYSDHEESSIKPLTESEIIQKVDQLNSLPRDVLQKVIHPRISDIRAEVTSNLTCKITNKCKKMTIMFYIMFAYTIRGHKDHGESTVMTPYFNFRGNSRFILPGNLERKAGYILLKVSYSHHTTIHQELSGTNPFGHEFIRTVWSLGRMRPVFKNSSFIMTKKTIDIWEEWRNKEPTIENHELFMQKYAKSYVHNIHNEGTLCTCGFDREGLCERGNAIHTQEQYCNKYCKKFDPLVEFNAHPQFMSSGYSYCAGDITRNPVSKEAQATRNIYGFINNLIDCMPVVNPRDARGSFEYFTGALHNSYLLFNYNMNSMRSLSIIDQEVRNNVSSTFWKWFRDGDDKTPINLKPFWKSSDTHNITPGCYCLPCLQFRLALQRGMLYDPNILVLGTSPRINKDAILFLISQLKNHEMYYRAGDRVFYRFDVSEYPFGDNDRIRTAAQFIEWIVDNIDIADSKYHIKVSNYDNRAMAVMNYNTGTKLNMFYDSDKQYMVVSNEKREIQSAIQEVFRLQKILGSYRGIFNHLSNKDITKDMNDILIKLKDMRFEYKDIEFNDPYFPDLTSDQIKRVNKTLHKRRSK